MACLKTTSSRSPSHLNLSSDPMQIKELLALEQQQAIVVQAYESVKQAEETVKQGRAIMMFTVVTIVFVSSTDSLFRAEGHVLIFTDNLLQLPLSFMSSVFGMNAAEFDSSNKMSLGAQFRIMCKETPFCLKLEFRVSEIRVAGLSTWVID